MTTTTTKVETTKPSSAAGSNSTLAEAVAEAKVVSSSSETSTSVNAYTALDRDVIVGDRTNTRLANRLLVDFCSIHCQIGSSSSTNSAARLVKLIQVGMPSSCFLQGKGMFVKISGTSSTIAEPAEAVEFCEMLMEEERKKPLIVVQQAAAATGDSKMDVDPKEAAAKEKTCQPGEYDVKLRSISIDAEEDFSKHKGNLRFQELLEKHTASSVVTIAAPHAIRVTAALDTLRETELLGESSKVNFMVHTPDDKAWIVLNKLEAAEFVLACVFDRLLDLPAASTATDIKALIPSIGTAEISQFSQFLQPGTTPIREPSEFDVLFGRGGMTNNHPGNRRFRDIISLHRPDYVRAIKIEKPNVARRIVAAIRGGNPPGRFMKRNSTNLMWYDVGNRHATEKTSQALREKSQAEKNGKVVLVEGDVRKRLLEQALYEARVTRMRLSKEGAGRIGNGALDPETFQLMVPKQYLPEKDAAATLASDDKSNDKPLLPKVDLPLDLKDYKMADANGGSTNGPSSSIGILDSHGDIMVTENDILCGRGGLTNHHKGNKRFRDIVALHRPDYVRAAKVHKPSVARMIVKAIRNSDPPGRFLKKDDKTSKWYDIGDKRAAEKASQALREKTPDEKRHVDKGSSSPTSDTKSEEGSKGKKDSPKTGEASKTTNGEKKRKGSEIENGDVAPTEESPTNGRNEEAKKAVPQEGEEKSITETATDLHVNKVESVTV